MITEEFTDPTGRFLNYDTLDYATQTAVNARKHINLRSFANEPDPLPRTMDYLDTLTLAGLAQSELESNRAFIEDEGWTGSVTTGAIFEGHNALSIECSVGSNVTESLTESISIAEFEGFLSISLPNCPVSSINFEDSTIRLENGSHVETLAFADGTTSGSGSIEIRYPISVLNEMEEVTRVTFDFVVTASCAVIVSALRLLAPSWTPATLDIDTRHQRLEPIVNVYGVPVTTPALPIMWRASANPGGPEDPRPFDSRLSVLFNTGSQSETNSLSLFLRQRREDFLTQLDLNGNDIDSDGIVDLGYDQGALDRLTNQPDYGLSQYDPTAQSDFDTQEQNDIDGIPQTFLERLNDTFHQSWIKVDFQWSDSGIVTTISNTETLESGEYVLQDDALEPNTEYVWEVDLRENTLRIQVFPINSVGQINRAGIVFDSLEITDSSMLLRRKGRIGWSFTLADADTYIKSIRSQYLMFGEYVSQPFESYTPVVGARLYVSGSADRQLYVGAESYKDSSIDVDTSLSNSADGSFRVSTVGPGGFASLPIVFEDFENSHISFDIFYPRLNFDQGIRPTVSLLNERGFHIELPIPHLQPDQWFTIDLVPLQARLEQTGSYRVVIGEYSSAPTTFWVDNLSVKQRTIVWSGRAQEESAWGDYEAPWVEFRDLINSNDGIMFRKRGNFAQVRGRALSQDALIEKVYFKPKYAELGRLVWGATDRAYNGTGT